MDAAPEGSTVILRYGKSYTIDNRPVVFPRSRVTLNLNGATLAATIVDSENNTRYFPVLPGTSLYLWGWSGSLRALTGRDLRAVP